MGSLGVGAVHGLSMLLDDNREQARDALVVASPQFPAAPQLDAEDAEEHIRQMMIARAADMMEAGEDD